jgi:hypothetical protein
LWWMELSDFWCWLQWYPQSHQMGYVNNERNLPLIIKCHWNTSLTWSFGQRRLAHQYQYGRQHKHRNWVTMNVFNLFHLTVRYFWRWGPTQVDPSHLKSTWLDFGVSSSCDHDSTQLNSTWSPSHGNIT